VSFISRDVPGVGDGDVPALGDELGVGGGEAVVL
jgi:hypothetical protein